LNKNKNPEVTHVILQLINHLVENDPKLQERSCLVGILLQMIKYTEPEFPRNIRVEAAYYIGNLIRDNSRLKFFISSGGLKALVHLLDLNYKENNDIIHVALDSLVWIFDTSILSKQDLSRILCKCGAFQRLVLLLQNFYSSKEEIGDQGYLQKIGNLLISFAECEDSKILQRECDDKTLLVLQLYIKKFTKEPEMFEKIIRIIEILAQNPIILERLERNGLVSVILDRISEMRDQNMNENILKNLF